MKIAITRGISPRFAECELTHLQREPIDLARAHQEHAGYVAALRGLGVEVIELPAVAEQPDCVFVEDTALVYPECAVITRPGAASRRGETVAVEAALAPWRRLHRIEAPGTLDGGDVLSAGRDVFVGETARSNAEGITQLARLLAPYGYRVRGVPVHGCLHLKSAVTEAAPGILLINPAWVDPALFAGFRLIEVDPAEPGAANALRVGDALVYARHSPRTLARLQAAGIHPVLVDAAEVAKAEGAVTCCSLVFEDAAR
jgi:dimethylargininase